MKWRTGRHVAIHVYEQLGDEPANTDRPLGTFLHEVDAERACVAVNNWGTRVVLQARIADAIAAMDDMTRTNPEHRPVLGRIRELLAGRENPQ